MDCGRTAEDIFALAKFAPDRTEPVRSADDRFAPLRATKAKLAFASEPPAHSAPGTIRQPPTSVPLELSTYRMLPENEFGKPETFP